MNIDELSREEIREMQERKFQNVIPHFFATSFYHKKLKEVGVREKDIKTLSDLSVLPFTTKDELRDTSPLERSPYGVEEVAFFFSSTGTTGEPTVYVWTRQDDEVIEDYAPKIFGQLLGIGPGDIVIFPGPLGMPLAWYNILVGITSTGAGFLPIGLVAPPQIIDALVKLPITVMICLPLAATRLFEFAVYRDLPLETRLRQIQCAADFLTNQRRKRIEQYWNVDCYDTYGISEIGGPLASECSLKNGMHFRVDYIYMEVVDPNTKQPVPEGEEGVAVYTTLWEKGAPLLRYWSEDFVTVTWEQCGCGRKSARIYFRGRPRDCAEIGDKRIFGSDIEEVLLSFPEVGNEYACELQGSICRATCSCTIEQMPGRDVPIAEVEGQLSQLLGIPVSVSVVPPGSMPRDTIKPLRIIDRRERD